MQLRFTTKLSVYVGILGGGLLLAGCDKIKAPGGRPPGDAPPPPVVAIVVLQPESMVLTTELAGRISANLVAEVRPQVGGIIQERRFTEGSDVKAGNVLYQIDPSMFKAACNSANAVVARSEANVIPIKHKAERYQELVKIKAVSQQDYDEAVAALKLAEADLEVSKAAAEIARTNLAYTQVTAPISGRIGKSSVTTGALVTASQPTPLAVIQQLDPVYVNITQSSTKLLQAKRSLASGQLTRDDVNQANVKLFLEDGTPYLQPGALKFSDVTVDPSTGSVTLRTVFPNPDQNLLPGMYVRVVVEDGVLERALLVPQRGITRDPRGNATALVVNAEDIVELRTLQTDRNVGDRWLIRQGLAAGDRLIVEGVQKVRPGMAVRVVPFTPEAPAVSPTPATKPQPN